MEAPPPELGSIGARRGPPGDRDKGRFAVQRGHERIVTVVGARDNPRRTLTELLSGVSVSFMRGALLKRAGRLVFATGLMAACGGGRSAVAVDDASDSFFQGFGTAREPIGTPLDPPEEPSQWRWVAAHCTEGPLDLAAHGFEQDLRVVADGEALRLVYDQSWPEEGCTQTVVQRAQRVADSHEFDIVEEVRVALPSNDECMGTMERPRRGEVRRRGTVLEVLVQRSFVWCGGLEVRMVYVPQTPTPLAHDQIARHYVAHVNRRDPAAIAALFSAEGSLVEPFLVTPTGGASRHDGREEIERWFAESFAGLEWLALRPRQLEPGDRDNHVVLRWTYMDPRLEAPFEGQSTFTIAAGEIFESRIELNGTPPRAAPIEDEAEADAESET